MGKSQNIRWTSWYPFRERQVRREVECHRTSDSHAGQQYLKKYRFPLAFCSPFSFGYLLRPRTSGISVQVCVQTRRRSFDVFPPLGSPSQCLPPSPRPCRRHPLFCPASDGVTQGVWCAPTADEPSNYGNVSMSFSLSAHPLISQGKMFRFISNFTKQIGRGRKKEKMRGRGREMG